MARIVPIGPSSHFRHTRPRRPGTALLAGALCVAAGVLATPVIAGATGPDQADVPTVAPAVRPAALPPDTTQVRVVMTENDTQDVIVTSAGGVSAPGVTRAPAVLFGHLGNGVWSVWTGQGCGGPWTEVTQPAVKAPTASPVTPGDLLTLCGPTAATTTTDQGTITAVYNSAGAPRTVNTLPLEEYVADVVPGESPSYWGTLGAPGPQGHDWGFQELEAQAVAVRSYVLADHYTTYATTCDLYCQTYRGTRYATSNSIAAAADTAGEVLVMPGGAIAPTEYSSSTGGYTASTAEGSPFNAVPDAGDAVCVPSACNTRHNWAATVALSSIAANWPTYGPAPTVTVSGRNGLGTWGGRVTQVTLSGNGTTGTVGGSTFAIDLGLYSNYFTITSATPTTLHLVGHGWGHGIGMGQWGAFGYAIGTDGGQGPWTWQKILAHYYSPATLQALPGSPTSGSPGGHVGGFWLTTTAGGIFHFGNATPDGSMAGTPLSQPVVAMAAPATGRGYWEVATDGGIFTFGDLQFYGSMGGHHLNQPVVGIAATPTGGGYWEVATDGGIFTFGNAPFYGSMGGQHLNKPIVGMAATPTGHGYWLVASDGGIFTFGNAAFYGSAGSLVLNKPIVGMAATPTGGGYWLVASDGGIFTYGNAVFEGSAVNTPAGNGAVAILPVRTGQGYLIASGAGRVASFGDAPSFGDVSTVQPGYAGHVVGGATTPG